MRPMHPIRLALLPLAAVLALVGCADGGDRPLAAAQSSDAVGGGARTITARGVGRVSGQPDTARVNVGVQARAESAAAALDQTSSRTSAVLDVLRDQGVADEDLQTAYLSIHPIFEERGQEVTAYEASNTVTATIRDVEQAGQLIDAVVQAVDRGVTVHGISFSIEDTGELMATARVRAVEEARRQAQQLAEAAGLDLGDVRSVTEGVAPGGPMRFAADAESGAAVPVQPGTQELAVEVTVVFDAG